MKRNTLKLKLHPRPTRSEMKSAELAEARIRRAVAMSDARHAAGIIQSFENEARTLRLFADQARELANALEREIAGFAARSKEWSPTLGSAMERVALENIEVANLGGPALPDGLTWTGTIEDLRATWESWRKKAAFRGTVPVTALYDPSQVPLSQGGFGTEIAGGEAKTEK